MKILLIVGSGRKRSFNRQLALQAAKDLEPKAQVSLLDYKALPIFDQDLEAENPAIIQTIRQEVSAADGIWIFTPEYNYAIPGGLKNLLDWLSRPSDPADRHSPAVMKGKPVTISGAGGKNATASCRRQLSALLKFMGCRLMPFEKEGYAVPIQEMIADKWTLTAEDLENLAAQARDFVAFIEQPEA